MQEIRKGRARGLDRPLNFRSGFRFHFLGFLVCALLFTYYYPLPRNKSIELAQSAMIKMISESNLEVSG